MKNISLFVALAIPFACCCCSCNGGEDPVTPAEEKKIEVSAEQLSFGWGAGNQTLSVTASADWGAVCTADWVKISPSGGSAGGNTVTVSVDANELLKERSTTILFKSGSARKEVAVSQDYNKNSDIVVPEGYTMVWHDEFNGSEVNKSNWDFEDWRPGYVNNELQRYVPGGVKNGVKTAFVENGALNIVATTLDGEVISARMNSCTDGERQAWLNGWFEARILLPSGKGTWPAFWMMPTDQSLGWPKCGEIDIMEEVGYHPNYTSSSIHCDAYNHVKNTQKTAERFTDKAEGSFHVYALEWTPEYIQSYVDGVKLLRFNNDGKNNVSTWPFNKPFYLTLNLAWGGSWGGAQGVDAGALPATMQVDYVRVFQKQ